MSTLQRLRPDHAAAYRTLMLAAYAEAPDAFVATVAERAAQPLGFWLDRLDPAPGAPTCSFGVFEGDTLLGAASLQFETRPKTRHKASLLGMFVAPAARRHGLGEQLVRAVLAEARSRAEARVVIAKDAFFRSVARDILKLHEPRHFKVLAFPCDRHHQLADVMQNAGDKRAIGAGTHMMRECLRGGCRG